MNPGRYAIILTHNRPELLADCVNAIGPQADFLVIIDNASDPPVYLLDCDYPYVIIRVLEQPPNLSRLWNVGILVLSDLQFNETEPYDIAFLCDDTVVPEGWFQAVSWAMRQNACVAGSTHCAHPVAQPIIKRAPDSDVWNRMCPWAFVVRGEAGIRADEDLKWWWGDTHMDFTARQAGGMVIAPGPVVPNLRMGEFTNIYAHLGEQSGRDGETFAAKWGRPW